MEAIRAAARGDALISPAVTVRLLERMGEQQPTARAEVSATPLTARELEVARVVADGRTNQEISDELFVSLSTVKTHMASIQTKLKLRNRVEVAAWASRCGVVGDR